MLKVTLGERALPRFVSFNTFQRLIGVFHRHTNDWLSVFRGFLRFLKGSKTSPIRRTPVAKRKFLRIFPLYYFLQTLVILRITAYPSERGRLGDALKKADVKMRRLCSCKAAVP